MGSSEDFKARPVGTVEEGISREKSEWVNKSRYQIMSRVRVHGDYADGLLGLDGYSHIMEVWWMHEENEVTLRVKPWGKADVPEVSIFATRFPVGPNHIAVSDVELLEV